MALNLVGLAPLVLVVLGVALVVALGFVDDRWDRAVTQTARRAFGRYVSPDPERERLLRSAFIEQSYRGYAARTLLYASLAGLAGSVLAAYVAGGFLLLVPTLVDLAMGFPNSMVNAVGLRGFELVLTVRQTLFVTIGAGLLGGLGGAGLTYLARWELPQSRAALRQRNIDEGLPRTVAFMYALSRGGVAVPTVLRTLQEHDGIYGEGAREMRVAVREMDLFGRDMITAVRRMAARSPSEEFKTFAENLASVLQSGRSLSTFLESSYERYQEEAIDRQEEILEHLGTIAEAYVTVLVAAVLFLITILLVFGLTVTDTLVLIQLVGYLMVPLANAGFIVYLGQLLQTIGINPNQGAALQADGDGESVTRPDPVGGARLADGGLAGVHRRMMGQLDVYDQVDHVLGFVRAPLESVRRDPTNLLYLTIPLAALFVALRAPAAFETDVVNLRALDDVLVQATLFVLATFAVARFLYIRRIRRIEAATPELLERLASLNEAGMTVTESLERLRGSDVGALSPEVDRIWADVSMGANVEDALVRFGRRVRTVPVTRVVALLSNALRASGSLGPVLRIAATQARADLRLRRRRRQTMFSYLVVIYIGFAVFLVIIVVVQEVLVPALPSDVPTPPPNNRLGVNVDQFARFGDVDKAAYTLVFFHTALIHAVFSGFIGGLLGEGTLRDGAKHAAILLGVAYLAFVVLSSPVASLALESPAAGSRDVSVDSVSLSEGGFVVFHLTDQEGPVVGTSPYFAAGTHRDVTVTLDRSVPAERTLVAVAYQDSNGDRQLTLDGPDADEPYAARGAGAVVAVAVEVGG